MNSTPTPEQILTDIERRAESFASMADPAVRNLVIKADTDALERKFSHEDVSYLDASFRDRFRAKRERDELAKLKDEDQALTVAIGELRAATNATAAKARELPSEAQLADPRKDRAAHVTARMCDAFEREAAERWYSEHENDPHAIAARYKDADENLDRALVRLIEEREGPRAEDSLEGDAANTLDLSPLLRAIRERRQARVPSALRERAARLTAAESKLAHGRMLLTPSDQNISDAIGRMRARSLVDPSYTQMPQEVDR